MNRLEYVLSGLLLIMACLATGWAITPAPLPKQEPKPEPFWSFDSRGWTSVPRKPSWKTSDCPVVTAHYLPHPKREGIMLMVRSDNLNYATDGGIFEGDDGPTDEQKVGIRAERLTWRANDVSCTVCHSPTRPEGK